MSEAQIGYSTRFDISTDGGTTFQPVSEIIEITPPSDTIDTVDATHMSSPNATREFILGLRDPGEASLEMAFIPGSNSDVLLQSIRDSRQNVTCRITFPNDATWTFQGILTGYEATVPLEDRMTATVTFKVTGSTVVGEAA
ncbi:phage tail protein [Aureimonas altamirensis]|uniref:phage tail tube protein n=1 Tax=Aureimonas altamirensis TaxID=370622 RepID=UPI002037153D|nr:phage tail tube protein [Aureimonas altamirensis]MCM2506065.1 phage tail protein [Aureimonas altamirensis]